MSLLCLQSMSTDAKDFTQNSYQILLLPNIWSIKPISSGSCLVQCRQITWTTLPGSAGTSLHFSIDTTTWILTPSKRWSRELLKNPWHGDSCHLRGWLAIWAHAVSFRGFSSQQGDCRQSVPLCRQGWPSEGTAVEHLLEKTLGGLPGVQTGKQPPSLCQFSRKSILLWFSREIHERLMPRMTNFEGAFGYIYPSSQHAAAHSKTYSGCFLPFFQGSNKIKHLIWCWVCVCVHVH